MLQSTQNYSQQLHLGQNKKGIYSLKQATILAYNKLVKHLEPFGYAPPPFSFGLWTYKTHKISFCLCADDFGVKYYSKKDDNHLLDTLKAAFKITVDWQGKKLLRPDFELELYPTIR